MPLGFTQALRRRQLQRKPLAVTDLTGMVVCEQQVVLEKHHGTRFTASQKESIKAGEREHKRHDAAVRHHSTSYPIWQSLAVGVVLSIPLSLACEYLLPFFQEKGFLTHLMARIMFGPGAIYRELGGDVLATLSGMLTFMLIQIVYYTMIAFAVISLSRRSVT